MDRIPEWTAAVQVIQFGWIIANSLVQILQGTEAGERLKKLVDSFNQIGQTTEAAYKVQLLYLLMRLLTLLLIHIIAGCI